MKKSYSRLASVEEKKNIKNAYWYIFLSIVAVIFLFFLGLPTLIKFAAFITEVSKSDKPVDVNDITPPAPPQFESLPEFTNKKNLLITGFSEEGASILLSFNSEDIESLADVDGKFSIELKLNNGENNLQATAKDHAGNSSQPGNVYKIAFDDKAPELTLSSPSDGSAFFGSGQRQTVIKGATSNDAEVYINDKFVSVMEDNTFSFATTLSEGANSFEIKAIDKAGNETKSTLGLNFSS